MIKEKSFEEAMQELESIVKKIEDEETPLESILELYERGTELSTYCQDILSKTQKKLESIQPRTEISEVTE
ncbi:MAG: exodeoxyribonuclease VII small subunit [Candidatus Marinimicrobia bacterium]|nr:exodeoxyribonuclease VII small subunit [Candidatus Neomarinimicrobiota bacterium]